MDHIDLGLWGVLKEVTYFREGAEFFGLLLVSLVDSMIRSV